MKRECLLSSIILVIISLFFNLHVIMFTELCRSNINKLLMFFITCRVKNYIFSPPSSHLNRIKCTSLYIYIYIYIYIYVCVCVCVCVCV